jgi:hypothetical protein
MIGRKEGRKDVEKGKEGSGKKGKGDIQNGKGREVAL